jgi:hypothetical protein
LGGKRQARPIRRAANKLLTMKNESGRLAAMSFDLTFVANHVPAT